MFRNSIKGKWATSLLAMTLGLSGCGQMSAGDLAAQSESSSSKDSVRYNSLTAGVSYPVPAGCAVPQATGTGRSFYVDPASGSSSGDGSSTRPWRTLAEVSSAGLLGSVVKAGDTVYLRNGNHGSVSINGVRPASFIAIEAQSGHKPFLSSMTISNSSRLLVEGLTISRSSQAPIVQVQASSDNVIISRNEIYAAASTEGWSASQFIALGNRFGPANVGISTSGPCSTALYNDIRNVYMGITMDGTDSLAEGNRIQRFVCDGMRPLNSRITFRRNVILDHIGVEDNHPDGIQMYELNGRTIQDITIDGNVIIEKASANLPYSPELQAITVFDGLYERLKIVNNVVIVSHWHGITVFGARDSEIVNNTVTGSNRPWIQVANSKEGRVSSNVVVRNNLSNSFSLAGGAVASNNITLGEPTNHFVRYDLVNRVFDLHLKSTSSAISAGTTSNAPAYDAEGRARSAPISVGAYEYGATATPTPAPSATPAPQPTATPVSQPPPSTSGNLIANPSFESDFASWSDAWGTGVSIITSGQRSGTKAMRLSAQGGGRAQPLAQALLVGASYRLSAYAKIASGDVATLGVDFYDAAGAKMNASQWGVVTSVDYQLFTLNFVVPQGAAKARVFMFKNGGSMAADFDDVSLVYVSGGVQPTPAPTPIPTPTPTPVPTPVPTPPMNGLISNGGFEAGFTSWSDAWGTGVSIITSGQRTGASALRLSAQGGGRAQPLASALQVGASYRLSGYAKIASGDVATMGMDFYDAAGTKLNASVWVVISATSYQLHNLDFVVPQGTAKARVFLFKNGGAGSADFDDLSLVKSSSSSPAPTATPAPTPAPTPVPTPVPTPAPAPVAGVPTSPSQVGYLGAMTALKSKSLMSSIPGVSVSGGTYFVNQAGTVIDGFDLRGASIIVQASNVTIRNSVIDGGGNWWMIRQAAPASGMIVENVTFDGTTSANNTADMLNTDMPATIRRNRFVKPRNDAMKVTGGLVEANYVEGAGYAPGAHGDGIQMPSSSARLVIRNNFFDLRVLPGMSVTSTLWLDGFAGPISDVHIEGNVLLGGGYTVGLGSGTPMTFINNRLGGGLYGYNYALGKTITQYGNTDYFTGAAITLK